MAISSGGMGFVIGGKGIGKADKFKKPSKGTKTVSAIHPRKRKKKKKR